MRIPDLQFVITNDFEHLKLQYFFQTNECLKG